MKFEEYWGDIRKKLFAETIPKKFMGQSKEIKQKWKEPKNFDICFSVIFSCYENVLFIEETVGTRLYCQPTLRF